MGKAGGRKEGKTHRRSESIKANSPPQNRYLIQSDCEDCLKMHRRHDHWNEIRAEPPFAYGCDEAVIRVAAHASVVSRIDKISETGPKPPELHRAENQLVQQKNRMM